MIKILTVHVSVADSEVGGGSGSAAVATAVLHNSFFVFYVWCLFPHCLGFPGFPTTHSHRQPHKNSRCNYREMYNLCYSDWFRQYNNDS